MYDEKNEEQLSLQDILSSQNIAELLSDEELREIGQKVVDEYEIDKESRAEWEERMETARKLATQVMEPKTTPWQGASNVKFPLLTIASLQFSSRAYPIVVPGKRVVKCAVTGQDPNGQKLARAERVSTHMSYQVLVQDENWEEEQDRLLMVLPITGTTFKKSYYDHVRKCNVSELVLPYDLVLPYYGRFETVPRKTHILRLTPNEVKERQLSGAWLDLELAPPEQKVDPRQEDQGFENAGDDPDRPREILEQHRLLDLDGDDLGEPYIVTVDRDSGKVFRIVARFVEKGIHRSNDGKAKAMARAGMHELEAAQMPIEEKAVAARKVEQEVNELKASGKIIRIDPIEHFTKYSFVPSPDGGIYDLGFGVLLGPVNASVDTLINQLIDSGTLQNSNSGFIGRGARIKSGKLRFRPFEWQRIDVPGTSLKDNLVPLPVNEPSPVLFQLLELLINYGERITSVTDLMVGETPGQNTPATTSANALDQGLKVFAGVLKRVYRSMSKEFKKLYVLNSIYLDPQSYYRVLDDGTTGEVFKQDYEGDPADITPEADPTIVSEVQRIKQAEFIATRARTVPGYNAALAERKLLQAMGISDIDQLFPVDQQGKPTIKPPPNIEAETKIADAQRKMLESKAKADKFYSEIHLQQAELEAKIANLNAQSAMYDAQAESEVGQQELERLRIEIQATEAAHKIVSELAEKASESNGAATNGVEGTPPNNGVPSANQGQGGQAQVQ